MLSTRTRQSSFGMSRQRSSEFQVFSWSSVHNMLNQGRLAFGSESPMASYRSIGIRLQQRSQGRDNGGAVMARGKLPPGLIPSGGSLNFTESTIPEALQRQHALAPGRWGVLHVLEGSLRFVDMDKGRERVVEAPDVLIIHPGSPHRVAVGDVLRCRIDFFKEPEGSGH